MNEFTNIGARSGISSWKLSMIETKSYVRMQTKHVHEHDVWIQMLKSSANGCEVHPIEEHGVCNNSMLSECDLEVSKAMT